MGNYADPNVEDWEFTVKVSYASDPLHDAGARASLLAALEKLATAEGVDIEAVGGGGHWDPPLRFALVGGARDPDEVEAYLPDDYHVAGEAQITVSGNGAKEPAFVICGQDYAGWTLDGYIVPRLASGHLSCVEVDQQRALELVDGEHAREAVAT